MIDMISPPFLVVDEVKTLGEQSVFLFPGLERPPGFRGDGGSLQLSRLFCPRPKKMSRHALRVN
jgi:hypothetical protein